MQRKPNLLAQRTLHALVECHSLLSYERKHGRYATQDKSYIARRLNLLSEMDNLIKIHEAKMNKKEVELNGL